MRIVIGLLCLFFLVIFHEFGHFIAAKLCKVKVESFSFGFGPILFHKKIKGTDFRLSLVPLGGYCGMKGEKDFSEALKNGSKEIVADNDSLYGTHPLKRIIIAFAGPFFNFLFCVLGFTVVSMISLKYYTLQNTIQLPEDSIYSTAREAGILTGDKIIKIDGKNIEDFSDLVSEISVRPDCTVDFEIERNNEILKFPVYIYLDKESGTGKIGVQAFSDSIIEKETKSYDFFSALKIGFEQTFNVIKLTFIGISTIFKGVNVEETFAGPARVVDLIGTGISSGFDINIKAGIVTLFNLLALISISLCIMNLLPFPVLDGGLILFAFIEFLSRKKINPKFLYYIQFVGLAFILFMFVMASVGDIKYFYKKN